MYRYIHSKNRANMGYTLAVNHLADKSDGEIKSMNGYKKSKTDGYNGGKPFPYNKNDFKNLPSEIDWRIAGAVTPVKGSLIFQLEHSKLHFSLFQNYFYHSYLCY